MLEGILGVVSRAYICTTQVGVESNFTQCHFISTQFSHKSRERPSVHRVRKVQHSFDGCKSLGNPKVTKQFIATRVTGLIDARQALAREN